MGTIVLFQAVYELLKQSASPRFVTISSSGGSLDGRAIKFPVGGVSYGATKAALNWVTRKMHFENEWLGTYKHSIITSVYLYLLKPFCRSYLSDFSWPR